MRLAVPLGVVLGSAEAKGAGEVDDPCAGGEQGRRKFHGNFRSSGQEDDGKSLGLYGFRSAGQMNRAGLAANGGRGVTILAMVEEDGLDRRVMGEQADEFGAAIAGVSHDAHA